MGHTHPSGGFLYSNFYLQRGWVLGAEFFFEKKNRPIFITKNKKGVGCPCAKGVVFFSVVKFLVYGLVCRGGV